MGEYAKDKATGEEIKIGTCENMTDLRLSQRGMVEAVQYSVDVNDPETAAALRFRFPFPDEDHCGPGEFDEYDRAVAVPGGECECGSKHQAVVQQKMVGDEVWSVFRCLDCRNLYRTDAEGAIEITDAIQAEHQGDVFMMEIAKRILQGYVPVEPAPVAPVPSDSEINVSAAKTRLAMSGLTEDEMRQCVKEMAMTLFGVDVEAAAVKPINGNQLVMFL